MNLNLRPMFIAFGVIGAILVGLIWGVSTLFRSDEIKTKQRIEPIRIEVKIKKDQSDSTFVYKRL